MRDRYQNLTKPELENLIAECNFTEDEKNVFICMTKGYTVNKIAIECSLSESTVNRRIEDIINKVEKVKEWIDTKKEVPISEKYNLTLDEAAAYFNIGVNLIRDLANGHKEELVLCIGTKKLIKKAKMEKFLDRTFVL